MVQPPKDMKYLFEKNVKTGIKNRNGPQGTSTNERLARVEEAIIWLKRGYWIQTGISVSTLVAVVGLIITLWKV